MPFMADDKMLLQSFLLLFPAGHSRHEQDNEIQTKTLPATATITAAAGCATIVNPAISGTRIFISDARMREDG
jgi:hypothetical protein